MATFRIDTLWKIPKGQPYVIAVPTCSYPDGMGDLDMCTGAARDVRDIYPRVPYLAAKKIKAAGVQLNGFEDYGFIEVLPPPVGIGVFQTRRQLREAPIFETIQHSVDMLAEYASERPDVHIRVPFPITTKRRKETQADIRRIMSAMPDNVHVIQWR